MANNEKNEQVPASTPTKGRTLWIRWRTKLLLPTRGLRSWRAFPLDDKRLTSDARIGPEKTTMTSPCARQASNANSKADSVDATTIMTLMTKKMMMMKKKKLSGPRRCVTARTAWSSRYVTLGMAVITASMRARTSFGTGQHVYLVFTPFHKKGKISSGQKLGETHANVIIILVVVVTMVVLVCLFNYRCYKAVTFWLVGAFVLALGCFSVFYMDKIWQIYNICKDWITASLISWTFASGIFAIHWQGSLHVQQVCMVATCVFIALIFIPFVPPWTGLVLLAVIDVFDLVAVLTPCRPFMKLVKLAEERDQPLLRSLVHSTTMMWAVGMADREAERRRARKTSPEGADEERRDLVSGGSDDEDIETEMLEESNASARRAMRALGRSETSSERWRQRRLMNN